MRHHDDDNKNIKFYDNGLSIFGMYQTVIKPTTWQREL